jgi:hypothetical protein
MDCGTIVIKQVEIGEYFISTVYIPLLKLFSSNCYETMTFKGDEALCQYRHETEEDAIVVNDYLCSLIKMKVALGEEVTEDTFINSTLER